MYIFGFTVPLWGIFLGIILTVVVAWKVIKFALKILLIIIAFFAVLIGLDFLNVFGIIQELLFGII